MGKRKEFIGTVTSDKMQKTAIVSVTRIGKHAKYGRMIRHTMKFKAHNEDNAAKLGDKVLIAETRPLSKDKCFRIVKVIKKSATAHIQIKEE